MLASIVLSSGVAIANPAVAHAAPIAAASTMTAGRGEVAVLASWTPEGAAEATVLASVPPKSKIKKETLWLMIGLLASVAIAGLVSAIRRAKKIRED